MKLKATIAILTCKAIRFAARLLHRGGTAAPGRIALKLCPDLLSILSRGVIVVAVTGTNGKTTSSRMIEQAFSDAGLSYIANRSGANLMSGITTEFAMNSSIWGHCRKKYAIIECDEAAARLTLGMLSPKIVVVTNLFRDQLDRYGEVTHTLDNIRAGLEKTPDAVLCLNSDCSLTASLADDLPNKVVFFGVDPGAAPSHEKPEISDATHCICCKSEYEYDYVTYGHLGGFRCPKCGYARRDTQVGVSKIISLTAENSTVTMHVNGEDFAVIINLPAEYNIYNAVGAVAAVTQLGLSVRLAVDAVGRFHCGFGRMERFDIGMCGSRMMLVKNPAGCDQVIDFLSALNTEFDLVVCLNDKGADGTDISWIWDAHFEKLAGLGEKLHSVTVSGIRARDMHARLKYAGIGAELISVEQDYDALARRVAAMDRPVFIIPTYTAMLDFRACLVRCCGGADFWEG